MDSIVLLARCTDKRLYAMSTYQMPNGDWMRQWAFPVDETHVRGEEATAQQIQGSLGAMADYPGCPYCHNKNFVLCSCGKMTCWTGATSQYCAWCNTLMDNIHSAPQLTVSGGDIKSVK